MFTQKSVFKPNFRHFVGQSGESLCVGNGSPSREIPGHVDMDFARENSLKKEKCNRTLINEGINRKTLLFKTCLLMLLSSQSIFIRLGL